MRFDTDLWLRRLKEVEREFLATKFATQDTLRRVRLDPCVLVNGVKTVDLVRSVDNLDGTFTVRIFSVFETGLREYWSVVRRKDSPSRARDLIVGTAAYCRIPADREAETHSIREYRNYLVHERDDDFVPLSLDRTRHHLCFFLSFLR